MNCPFCERPLAMSILYGNKTFNWKTFRCSEVSCWVNEEFPRYLGTINGDGNFETQEYALGPYYVKVYPTGSCIYKMISCMLMDEVKVPRALWLNVTNTDATLDKLKMCVIFS
jgi:hypothetical protein